MANMNVTYSDMKDAAGKLRAGQHEMDSKMKELASVIDGLVGAGFQTDQASHTYHDTFVQFQTNTTQAIDALDGLATYLERAADAIQDTDSQLSSAIKS